MDAKLGFPTYQKKIEVFGVDLTNKLSTYERDQLLLKIDETHKLYVETECKMLEDFITELGENSHEFQMALMDVLGKENKAKVREIVMTLRELWLETNVLHKVAVFLRQCFADPVSRAMLTDSKDKHSKFARGILCIDIMDA